MASTSGGDDPNLASTFDAAVPELLLKTRQDHGVAVAKQDRAGTAEEIDVCFARVRGQELVGSVCDT